MPTQQLKRKRVRKKKLVSKKTASSATPVAVVAAVPAVPVVVTPQPVAAVSATTPEPTLEERWELHSQNLNNLWKSAKQCFNDDRKLRRLVRSQLKEARKRSRTRVVNPNKTKREPSGFACPSKISNELCEFLGVDYGTEMARTEVTKKMTHYIKDHNLQNPTNKRFIVPDDKLKSLLNVTDSDELTYFNLQKFLKTHFPKSGVQVSSSS